MTTTEELRLWLACAQEPCKVCAGTGRPPRLSVDVQDDICNLCRGTGKVFALEGVRAWYGFDDSGKTVLKPPTNLGDYLRATRKRWRESNWKNPLARNWRFDRVFTVLEGFVSSEADDELAMLQCIKQALEAEIGVTTAEGRRCEQCGNPAILCMECHPSGHCTCTKCHDDIWVYYPSCPHKPEGDWRRKEQSHEHRIA